MLRLVILVSIAACGRIGFAIEDHDAGSGSDIAWSLIQSKTSACGGPIGSCTITVAPTGSSHLLGIVLAANTVEFTPGTISSIAGGGTWIHPPLCATADAEPFVDCAYATSSSAGATSITVTLDGESNHVELMFFELGAPPGPITLEELPAVTSLGTINPVGEATTPSGNDAIVQAISWEAPILSIDGPYQPSFLTISDGGNVAAIAFSVNTSDGAAPTWTTQFGTGATLGLAFRSN